MREIHGVMLSIQIPCGYMLMGCHNAIKLDTYIEKVSLFWHQRYR